MAQTSETSPTSTARDLPKGVNPIPVQLEGSFLDKLLPHLKKIAVGLVVVSALLAVFFTYRWWTDKKSSESTARLAEALGILKREVAVPPPEVPGVTPPPADPNAFTSHAARAKATAAAMTEVGKVAGAAKIVEGTQLLAAGELDRAEATLRGAANGADLDGVLAREALGYVAEARAAAAKDPAERQRLLEAARDAFAKAQPSDTGARRDYALYHEARMLAELGKPAEAKLKLEKALELVPGSEIELDIQQRLADLEAATP